MKALQKNEETSLIPRTLEDLWFLTKIFNKNDEVSGYSFRRFKTDLNRAESGEKKKVFVTVKLDSVEFSESVNKLRLTGVILSGTPEEFVQVGEHHTIDVELDGKIVLHRLLNSYERAIIQESNKTSSETVLIVIIDERKALLAEVKAQGVKFKGEIHNPASKRQTKEFDSMKKQFYTELMGVLKNFEHRIVIAGPGFEKDSFKKYLIEKGFNLEKTSFEHCSSTEETAVYELLKNGLLEKIFKDQRIAREFKALEEFKLHVSKDDGYAVYGLKDVDQAAQFNAVSKLLVLDELMRKTEFQELISSIKDSGAEIIVFDSEDDAGKEFATFKLAAVLRFKLSY
ncbi:mRNA surveillance protein pelota [Candidatus Micrarchaeota archaeon]|nr:mRNA surveillance protein pelota [Candidatus Micrarchaeota archaeon]